MAEHVENSVHYLRVKKALTQEELAQRVDVTRQTIIAIERGHYAPSVLLALKIAAVFNVSVEDIFYISYGK